MHQKVQAFTIATRLALNAHSNSICNSNISLPFLNRIKKIGDYHSFIPNCMRNYLHLIIATTFPGHGNFIYISAFVYY